MKEKAAPEHPERLSVFVCKRLFAQHGVLEQSQVICI